MYLMKFGLMVVIGAVIGGVMGYVGKCNSGQCPLTANPGRGALVGGILAALFAAAALYNTAQAGATGPRASHAAGYAAGTGPSAVLHLDSEAAFQKEALEHKGLVLVDFYADWCGPCRSLAPVLEEFAAESADAVRVVKVNVDQAKSLAERYQVSSIPMLILFRDGTAVETRVGFQAKEELHAWIEAHRPAPVAPPFTDG